MITYYVGRDAVALGLDIEEKENSAAMVSECLARHGIGPWADMESELFILSGAILLIARPAAPNIIRFDAAVPRLCRLRQGRG